MARVLWSLKQQQPAIGSQEPAAASSLKNQCPPKGSQKVPEARLPKKKTDTKSSQNAAATASSQNKQPNKAVAKSWTMPNPKFKSGHAMLKAVELESVGPATTALHAYYMKGPGLWKQKQRSCLWGSLILRLYLAYCRYKGLAEKVLVHATKFPCHQQPAGNTCGFYTADHMMEALRILEVDDPQDFEVSTSRFADDVLSSIREKISPFLMHQVQDVNIPTALDLSGSVLVHVVVAIKKLNRDACASRK
ncbi:hypothetical protein C2845_PM15G05790 [Panicum miliaceum]|uniref:Ubiquitin-like protease family profile domain-containing protein n=1 Tax=Panicum miliaceum TaxID=4540 RepID=A0A3L6Q9E2_PANMI|nr:hypothetical protein C2845_PM15G05790 [Panicum miliaceum]